MASRIAGITIEIDGNTTKLQSSLKQLDSSIKGTANQLKDIDRLLKLDPKNTELLTQKQKALKDAISQTKERLQALKDAQSSVDAGSAQWDALQREIIDTEQKLKGLQTQYKEFGSVTKQQLLAVGDSMQKFGSKVTEVGNKLKPLSSAAGALVTGIGTLAYKSVSAADDLSTLSKQTGISTDDLQKMSYAAELVDVSVEDITGALKKLKPKMTENNATLEKLGVSVKNTDGSMRSATDVFYDSIKALSQVENETERDQIAMELFGKSADSLAGVIDDGGEALRKYGQEAEEMGLILSEDTISALSETDDEIQKVKATVLASAAQFGATAAQVLAPAFEKISVLLQTWTEKLRNLTPEQTATILKISGVVAAIAPLLVVGGKLITGIGTIVKVVGTLMTALGSPLLLAIAAVVTAGILLYKNWDKIKETAQIVSEYVSEKWNVLKDKTTNLFNNIKTTVVNNWNNLKLESETLIEEFKINIETKWNDLKTEVTNTAYNLKTSAVQIWTDLKTNLTNITETLKATVNQKWEMLKTNLTDKGTNIKTTLVDAWTALKTSLTNSDTEISNILTTSWDTLKTNATEKWDLVKTAITDAMSSVQSIIETTWSAIDKSTGGTLSTLWTTVSDKFDSIYTTISNSLSWIKSLFDNLSFSFPHISLPHFTWTWTDIGGWLSIPNISIEWYKKAYANPLMFTSPTVLGTASGFKGFGDGHGAEIVLSLEKLRELVDTQPKANEVTINIIQQPWQDAKQLAAEVQKVLVRQNNQRVNAYA